MKIEISAGEAQSTLVNINGILLWIMSIFLDGYVKGRYANTRQARPCESREINCISNFAERCQERLQGTNPFLLNQISVHVRLEEIPWLSSVLLKDVAHAMC